MSKMSKSEALQLAAILISGKQHTLQNKDLPKMLFELAGYIQQESERYPTDDLCPRD